MKSLRHPRSCHGIIKWISAAGLSRSTRMRSRRPVLELLEPRALLTTITEFPTASSTVVPTAITTGSDSNLWFVEQNGNAIGRINPTTQAMSTFSNGLPANANLQEITSGPNGDLWFTEAGEFANAIGMFDPNSTSQPIKNFGTSAGMTANSSPSGIVSVGIDIWFTQPLTDQIGKLDTSNGLITEFTAPSAMTDLASQIVLGPDGNLWFTEFGNIGYFNPATPTTPTTPTTLSVTQVALPGGASEEPLGIAVGPDQNIWYTAGVNPGGTGFTSYAVGVINPMLPNAVKETPLPSTTQPYGITAGPDSNVWVTVTSKGTSAGTIDQIDPSTRQITQTLAIPTNVVAVPNPDAITAGPDGNLWFADGGGAIGVVNTDVQPHFVVTTAPPSTVTAGQGFGLTVTAEYGSGIVDSLFKGNVTVGPAITQGGVLGPLHGTNLTVPAVQGVATFSGLSVDQATPAYIVAASSSGANAPTAGSTNGFNVVAAAATKLVVISQPPGSVAAGSGFGFTVVAEDQFNNIATSFSGTVTVTLPANNPGGSGTVLSGSTSLVVSPASATPGFATFSGLSLSNIGTGYTLGISSSPSLTTTTTSAFDVTVAPPPPPTISSESVVLNQKFNKKHKPVGKPTLSGYTITFSTAMNQTALADSGNYQVALKVIKNERVKVGKKTVTKKVTVLNPIGFSVTQVTADSVTLTLAGKQTFPKGGQITIIAAAPGGVDNTSDVFLAQNGVLAISPKGKQIALIS
jgi:streptogramin lyase